MKTDKKVALLFLDMEFTGFENEPNQAWEIGWILDVDGEIISQQSYYLNHTTEPSKWVRKNTLYEKVFQDENSYIIDMKTALGELFLDVLFYKEEYNIHVTGAAIEGDFRYLLEKSKSLGFDLGLHWRAIDLSNVFLGYVWAQGYPLATPIAVVKMLDYFGIQSHGKRHTVDVDNDDLRRLYYLMYPIDNKSKNMV